MIWRGKNNDYVKKKSYSYSRRNHPPYTINETLSSTDLRSKSRNDTIGFGPPPNYENLSTLNEAPPSYDCAIRL